ncbi:tetratricopeptide repeat protein [Spectribacter hydrogenooxidans]|uniref:Tetratricopeptide repeat protein n=1 Tax=Spectribacter hydrogenoxidans TaxID=3075608 RepID=A0ABU3C3B4_9GAMM|nr:tetratricopeptide repeat protein [Salinisphaera sp. W335]MDT0636045.1 tetratricopeptide repeat protein [Salinisphaera sp. W335]
MRGPALSLVWIVFAAGCSGVPSRPGPPPSGPDELLSQARGEAENKQLYTDLIREMMDQDRLYAAMAHLEAQEKQYGTTPELRLLRADLLRKLDQPIAAEQLYRGLLSEGQFRGRARHGLGLIYAPQDLTLAVRHLRSAVALLPTNAGIRNDLGYALLRQGEVDAAVRELATAYQLSPDQRLSRNNYIVALLIDGEERQAARIAAEHEVSGEQIKRLRERAASLQQLARRPATLPDEPRPAESSNPADDSRNASTTIGGGGG